MWIRSQDKENLLKTTDIYLKDNIRYKTEKQRFMRTDNTGKHYETWEDVDVIDKFICCEVWGDRTLLGKYKTKERALEVLDEIQDKIAVIETMRIMGVTELTSKIWEKVTREKEVRAVYQMPEE